MMGHHTRSESLFSDFRLEGYVPESHLLRQINRCLDFGFVREQLKETYSHTGRPSIDPEVLLRMLLIGYLYGITSERRLVEQVRLHIAYRWFAGIGWEQNVPHHSTFSKNRHGRFQKFPLFRELFEQVVRRCIEVGLVNGASLSVDSTQISADAHRDRALSRDQLTESPLSRTVCEYLKELARKSPAQESAPDTKGNAPEEEPSAFHSDKLPCKLSTTDPDAALSTKRGPAEFAYYDNYLIDNHSCLILGVTATPARLSQEIIAARQMLRRVTEQFGLQPVSLAADKSYGTGEFLTWLWNRHILPYIPVLDRKHQTNGFYTQDEFTPVPEENAFRCPAGELLRFVGYKPDKGSHLYRAQPSQCRGCPQKTFCTATTYRQLTVSGHEEVRERVRTLSRTTEFAVARRARWKIEALFSELRNQIRLRKVRLRRLPHVGEQFLLAATVQNLKRLVRFCTKAQSPNLHPEPNRHAFSHKTANSLL